MKSLEVYVMDTAVFECLFNKESIQAIWKYDDKELDKSDRIKSRSRFSKQQLVISECQLSDSGWYTCGSGGVSTKAELVVKGTQHALMQLQLLTPHERHSHQGHSFFPGNKYSTKMTYFSFLAIKPVLS